MLCYFQVYLSEDSLFSSSSKPSIQLFLLCQPRSSWSSPQCLPVVPLPHLSSILHSIASEMLENVSQIMTQTLKLFSASHGIKSKSSWPPGGFLRHPSFSPLLSAPVLPVPCQLLLHHAEYTPAPGLLHFWSLPEKSFSSYFSG